MLLSFSFYSEKIISRLGGMSLSSEVFVATLNITQEMREAAVGCAKGKLGEGGILAQGGDNSFPIQR